jgi:solute carrier family 7 (L-type amino acid transporter), member 9/15
VVAGSLLGNSFVASRMVVAAANNGWFPRLFGVVGQLGHKKDQNASGGSSDSNKDENYDAPINALMLSTILSAFYIFFGSFRALLTFNGLGEYTFFFLTVVGAIILRFREPDLWRPYRPWILVPAIFTIVSGFVVIRGAAFAPVQTGLLVLIWVGGVLFYLVSKAISARHDNGTQ